ncbi:hypothetical protein BH09BAC5_BH09BAC5_08880 [soil metagenome]
MYLLICWFKSFNPDDYYKEFLNDDTPCYTPQYLRSLGNFQYMDQKKVRYLEESNKKYLPNPPK